MATPAPPPLPVVQPRTSGMAIAGFVLAFLCGLLGLIFSAIALGEVSKSNGTVKGRGLAIAGLVISIAQLLIGVLAAVAIPAFMDYMKVAKKSEAELMLKRMAKGATRAYLETSAFPEGGAPLTPANGCCGGPDHKCPMTFTDWETPEWRALDFQVDQSTVFQYSYTTTMRGSTQVFEGHAVGDLDCDGTTVTYTIVVDATNGYPSTGMIQKPTNQD